MSQRWAAPELTPPPRGGGGGRLPPPWGPFQDAGYTLLDVRPAHAVQVGSLPPLHKDPFDRLLVAQALIEPLTLVTADEVVGQYSSAVVNVG